ncbi:MAG: SAM-dependent chlorinase/fluorinase, partial [Spirulinaceae cyanobacterium]
LNAYAYFPPGTVHVAVIDPGVGSQRRGIAVEIAEGFLVGPDNGLFSGILAQSSGIAAVELTNSLYWRSPFPSHTFHGRDIFAPVGAHLAGGIALKDLGKEVEVNTLVQLPLSAYKVKPERIIASIQYIDHFGNLITNIPAREVEGKSWFIVIGNQKIPATQTYSDKALGEVVSLVGSHGWIEVAVNGGSAKKVLELNWGDQVEAIMTIKP